MSKKNFKLKLKRPKTVAAMLNAAADYLDEVGWCQGDLKTVTGRVCAMGAINEVTRGDANLRESVYCTYAKYLTNGYCLSVVGVDYKKYSNARRKVHQDVIMDYNDAGVRKASDIKKTLRNCAKYALENG